MNITPLYELSSRLRNCMIAGTNLVMEDFRLRRAVEDIKPYAKAAPVFAKLAELTGQLLEPDRDDREELLLDSITLLDALLCTQAMVGADEPATAGSTTDADAGKPVKRLPQHGGTYSVKNIPYSQLCPLIEALTTSGAGHYAYVLEQHNKHPEIFLDYRVRAAMVQALGAAYSELADSAERWLKEGGSDVVWLLKKDFDPKGKKEMVRRVHVIEAICGAKENDFYVSMLLQAEKEVREELILALGHEPSNIDLLLELAQTESRGMKDKVLYTLACSDSEAAAEPFRKLLKKKPVHTFELLYLSRTGWASQLIAECMKDKLAQLEQKAADAGQPIFEDEDIKYWENLLPALIGKSGAQIEDVIMEAAVFADRWGLYTNVVFDEDNAQRNIVSAMYGRGAVIGKGEKFGNELSRTLQLMLRVNPDAGLCRLALKLFDMNGENDERNTYFGAAVLAKLYGSGDCTEWIKAHAAFGSGRRSGIVGQIIQSFTGAKNTEGSGRMIQLLQAATGIKCTAEGWSTESVFYNGITGREIKYIQSIPQRLEGNFTDMLIDGAGYFDDIIIGMVCEENKELCEKVEEYLYKRVLTYTSKGKPVKYFTALKKCGCTHCDGLAVHYLKVFSLDIWAFRYIVEQLPGSSQDKIDELMRAYPLIKSGKIGGGFKSEGNENMYLGLVDELRMGKL